MFAAIRPGTTKYSAWKMIRFAWTAISSFSALPLRLSVFLGLFVATCGFGYAGYSVFAAVVLHATVPGWTSLVCLNIIFSGATLVAVGLVGEYVARIYEEAMRTPGGRDVLPCFIVPAAPPGAAAQATGRPTP